MADLTYIQATQEVKIVGQDSVGDNVNYVSADANGNMKVTDYSNGPVSPGTAASVCSLIGGQYNSSFPTLTNGQQSAIQIDSSGKIIVSTEGRAASGTATVGNPVYIAGTDGTNARGVLTDSSGRIIIAPSGASASVAGFTVGDIVLSNTGNVKVSRTTYTEQSSNAQRSIVSSSANDTSAGTGARQVKITYYTSAGAGPNTETVTMNGTTAVNTTNTDICYIEKLEVVSVGSTGSNVGTITLKAATGGTGATIITINATDNRTFTAIHYVASGKTCYITGVNVGSNSSGIAQGGLYTLRAQDLNSTTNPDKQISDFLYLFGQSSGLTRNYDTPIQIPGPARVMLWVNPFSNNTVTFGGGFDFYDQ